MTTGVQDQEEDVEHPRLPTLINWDTVRLTGGDRSISTIILSGYKKIFFIPRSGYEYVTFRVGNTKFYNELLESISTAKESLSNELSIIMDWVSEG